MAYTGDLVEGKFTDSKQYADDASTRAVQNIATLTSFLADLELPEDTDTSDYEVDVPLFDPDARPEFEVTLDRFASFGGLAPVQENLSQVDSIDISFPTDSGLTFNENTFSQPSLSTGIIPSEPSINTVESPVKPELSFPDVPRITDVSLPSEPNISIPAFDAKAPVLSSLDVTEFNYSPGNYQSDIRLPLFKKILYDIAHGGTGLEVTVERDLYNRGRERQKVENEKLYREVEDQFSATGFSLPSGALASRLTEVSMEISRKTDQLNREITINQAELAQKNTQFTIEQARQIEGLLIEFFNQQENRSLEASKVLAQSAVEIFKARIEKLKLSLSKYQTEAEVYKQKVEAELVHVEIYRAKIEGTKASVEVQQARVNIYTAQVQALESSMKVYAVEMESAKIQAEMETLKIEQYKAQITAYVSTLEADKTKVDIYSAQIEGEKARAGIYSEKVNAYKSKVEAKKLELEAKIKDSENIVAGNNQKIEKYKADIEKYNAEVGAEVKNAALDVEGFKAGALVYESEMNARNQEYQALISQANSKIEYAKALIQRESFKIETVQKGYISLNSLKEKGYEGVMNVNAQLAASAMNSVNASASQSMSSGSTDSISETHTFAEKCCEKTSSGE